MSCRFAGGDGAFGVSSFWAQHREMPFSDVLKHQQHITVVIQACSPHMLGTGAGTTVPGRLWSRSVLDELLELGRTLGLAG